MRNFITFFALFFSLTIFAQNRVGIAEVQMSTAKGDQPAFEFYIPDTDSKIVLAAWNKFHKNLKVKPKQDKTQRNYYFSDNAFLEELSENTIDIYARIYETGGGVRFTCSFDLGGVFISSEKTLDKYNKTKLLLNKFYAQMAMDAIVSEIEKELASLEKIKAEYDAINKEINNFEKEAKEYANTIENERAEQEKVELALDDKSNELKAKQKELASKKDELKEIDKAGMVAELTTNMSNLKRTDLELTKIEKDIDRKEAEIATIQADISILKNNQVDKTEAKMAMEAKIKAIEDKLESLNIEEKEDKVKLLEQNINEMSLEQSDLNLRKSNSSKSLQQQLSKLEKVKEAVVISKQTKDLLQQKIDVQEQKLKELEDLKATIE